MCIYVIFIMRKVFKMLLIYMISIVTISNALMLYIKVIEQTFLLIVDFISRNLANLFYRF